MPARNVRIKGIRRDILPNTNTENHEIVFNIEIQKSNMFWWKPKDVRAQSQSKAEISQKLTILKYFELK